MDENDPKAERVMMILWQGKEAAHCDGDVFGYSNLVHILFSRTKKVRDFSSTTLMQIITNFFEPNATLNYAI